MKHKNLLFCILLFSIQFILGCKTNSEKIFLNFKNTSDNIVIVVDSKLEKHVSDRLQGLFKENLSKWEIKTESDKKDAVITTDKNNIPENWKIEEVYQRNIALKPDSFNNEFAGKFGKGFVIYIGSEKKEIEPIKKILEESYKNNPPEPSRIIFLGDIMLSRTVEDKSRKAGNWDWPFIKIK